MSGEELTDNDDHEFEGDNDVYSAPENDDHCKTCNKHNYYNYRQQAYNIFFVQQMYKLECIVYYLQPKFH